MGRGRAGAGGDGRGGGPAAGLLSSAEASRRLGVKPETLYAYVSRGLLRRQRSADGRRSLFDPAEVERLAGRSRQPAASAAARLGITSAITSIQGRSYRYRGVDATRLARERSFEEVAHWLWTGELAADADWRADEAAVEVGRAAQAALPPDTLPLERLRVIVAAMATTDELRLQLDPPAVVAAGQSLIAGMVACLPKAPAEGRAAAAVAARPGAPAATAAPAARPIATAATATPAARPPARGRPGGPARARTSAAPLAERLWGRLTAARPDPPLLAALDSAMVLMADHELAASTVAARAAASVRADPYAVVSAGLAVASGTLHAGASLDIEALLAEAGRPERAARAVGERLRRGERVRGFGHSVYKDGDPRADALLQRLGGAAEESGVPGAGERLAVAEAVLAAARRRRLPAPNVDFALATLASMAGMTAGAGEAIFVVARAAGWLAHALEEYQRGIPIRPRATYTGPENEEDDRGDSTDQNSR
jgi:citrate synthase